MELEGGLLGDGSGFSTATGSVAREPASAADAGWRSRRLTVAAVWSGVILSAVTLCLVLALRPTNPAADGVAAGPQHIFIVRHGDKFSSYPDCQPHGQNTAAPCFNASLMSNNPPLTPCGKRAEKRRGSRPGGFMGAF